MADKPTKLHTLFYVAILGAAAAVTIPLAKDAQRDHAAAKADRELAAACQKKQAAGNTCTEAETAGLQATEARRKRDAHLWVFMR